MYIVKVGSIQVYFRVIENTDQLDGFVWLEMQMVLTNCFESFWFDYKLDLQHKTICELQRRVARTI